jgi:hypothetical protein
MAIILKCPDCSHKFKWNTSEEETWPKFCPKCGVFLGTNRADDDIVLPFIRTTKKTETIDRVYRDIERGSEVRAQAASEMLGVPLSDVSETKITNLNDRRDTEIAHITPANPVSQFMAQNPQAPVGFNANANGVQYSGAVQTGPFPNMGARTRTMIQDFHSKISQGAAVSDRPGNETMQPGYRRRG